MKKTIMALCASLTILFIGCASAPVERETVSQDRARLVLEWYSAMRTETFLRAQWEFAKDCGESPETMALLGDKWNVAKRAENQALANYMAAAEK